MTDSTAPSFRDLVHGAKRSAADAPAFDTEAAPADPLDLFWGWLEAAVEADVTEPHAATLSTTSRDGSVTARTLLLKDVDDEAFWFSTSSLSPKGRQLDQNPRVALTLYWREQGRQIRILGEASPGPRTKSEQDFTSRHPDSRAGAIAMTQSDPIVDRKEADARLEAAKQRIRADDDFVPDDWNVYRVAPVSVEFWQATTGRDQVRLRYDRSGGSTADGAGRADGAAGWTKTELWP